MEKNLHTTHVSTLLPYCVIKFKQEESPVYLFLLILKNGLKGHKWEEKRGNGNMFSSRRY